MGLCLSRLTNQETRSDPTYQDSGEGDGGSDDTLTTLQSELVELAVQLDNKWERTQDLNEKSLQTLPRSGQDYSSMLEKIQEKRDLICGLRRALEALKTDSQPTKSP